ncbi:unnamed protein product [Phytophthora fragariaefolia]|uniref:Unnamed protein product n=1 Tax=Phytophthora fragariaefolia TaxID=1490495 RepID=A0A9W6Y059_9STRA|nr:unnamed protein product [Phytophthora fragariaefolia]
MPSPPAVRATGKRKRLQLEHELTSFLAPAPSKRKGSSDFLRKGQWTNTEERLARLLIEAFEDGYLPIYTGIRLRGYLAVQLQCDPMRVSKKLCAGAIDGKTVPKNYGQKKFKLRKKPFWDCAEAERRITELERLTRALWGEARMKKPSFLTLSSTRNVLKRRGSVDGDDSESSSPPTPAKGRAPSATPRPKRQKVFPIIYLNLSKKLKHYSVRGLGSSSSSSEPASSSDSDSEPVRLDGESLQAAYDLLTLCSPRGSKGKSKKRVSKKSKAKCAEAASSEGVSIKEEPVEDTSSADRSHEDKSEEPKALKEESSADLPHGDTPPQTVSAEDVPIADVSEVPPPIADAASADLRAIELPNAAHPVNMWPTVASEDASIAPVSSSS